MSVTSKRCAVVLLSLMVTTLFLAPSAVAEDDPRLDQQQPGVVSGSILTISGPEPLAADDVLAVGQLITVGKLGSLTEIQVPILCGGGCANITVQVQTTVMAKGPDGISRLVPSGHVLAATTRTHLEVPSGIWDFGGIFPDPPATVSWSSFPLPTPAQVSVGDRLAIVLRTSIPPLRGVPGYCGIWRGTGSYENEGDDAVLLNASGFWVPATANYGSSGDLAFKTFVEGLPQPDAQQLKVDAKIGAYAIGASSNQVLAQVVTPLSSGTLTAISVPVACEEGANLTVEIQEVTNSGTNSFGISDGIYRPNNKVISSSSVAMELVKRYPPGQGPSLREIPLRISVSVEVGKPYAIVLRNVGQCGWFQGPIGNPYTDGQGFYWIPPDPENPNYWYGWEFVGHYDDVTGRWDMPFATTVRH